MTSMRRQFRNLLAEPRLTVMPGACDALSARIIEAEGFPAIVAGGYAAIGSNIGRGAKEIARKGIVMRAGSTCQAPTTRFALA